MSTEQLESEIRRIRGIMFTLNAPDQEAAGQSIDRLKSRLAEARRKESSPAQRGQWSGLTRAELAKTGTTETDWA